MLVSRTSHEKRTKLKQNAWLRPAVSDAMLAYDAVAEIEEIKWTDTQDALGQGILSVISTYCSQIIEGEDWCLFQFAMKQHFRKLSSDRSFTIRVGNQLQAWYWFTNRKVATSK